MLKHYTQRGTEAKLRTTKEFHSTPAIRQVDSGTSRLRLDWNDFLLHISDDYHQTHYRGWGWSLLLLHLRGHGVDPLEFYNVWL